MSGVGSNAMCSRGCLNMNRCNSYSESLVCQDLGRGLDTLREDCKVAFTSRAVEAGDSYSNGTTFFLPCQMTPRCTLERLALEIFQQHTKGIEYNPETSGAEWWVLYLHTIDDVGFHWDRDYGIELEENRMVHPYLGTVTYLSNVGGPTVFLDMPGDTIAEEFENFSLSCCRVSYPKPGKHVTFDGNLLHGAPSSLYAAVTDTSDSEESEEEDGSDDEDSIPESEARVTFLVNIWLDHHPTQAEPLPADLIPYLSNDPSIRMGFQSGEIVTVSSSRHLADGSAATVSSWALPANDQSYEISVPLPTEESLAKLNDCSGKTFQIEFPRGDGLLLLAPSQEEGDEEDREEENGEEDEGKIGSESNSVRQKKRKGLLGEGSDANRSKLAKLGSSTGQSENPTLPREKEKNSTASS
jgi:hypothetical protein